MSSSEPVELSTRVDRGVRRIVRMMETDGWAFRVSTGQHLIGQHPDGSTVSISAGRGNRLAASNAAKRYRQWLNQRGNGAVTSG